MSNISRKLLERLESDESSRLAYTFCADGQTQSVTYEELARRVLAIAERLRRDAQLGDRVMLLLNPGLDYVAAFFACAAAGLIAVPAYPMRSNRRADRTRAVLRSAQPRIALHEDMAGAGRLAQLEPQLLHLCMADVVPWDDVDLASRLDEFTRDASAQDVAFLQYTSGSTGDPKGVIVTHANLLHNSNQMRSKFGTGRASRMVSWLPPYHDMGLILGILHPLFVGFESHLMAPAEFMQRPLAWLEAVSEHRATISGGPNFAYEACIRVAEATPELELDLSAWEVAFNGAEPIQARTLRRFAETFAARGFRRSAVYPCYGLAENTLMASGLCDLSSREACASAPSEEEAAREFVNCGTGIPDQQLAIVDPQTLRECEEGEVGEVWLAGPSVASGYWQQAEATRQTFGHQLESRDCEVRFMRTGDLGFVRGGALHVCGRIKDIIIVRGVKYYPQDVEALVEDMHPAVRRGGYCAAFASPGARDESIGITVELARAARHTDADALARSIRACVANELGLRVKEVTILQPGHFPKTSSGKIPRAAIREAAVAEAAPRDELSATAV
jgi:acyl-CoA synthetase (AMP-forming)/AMP-acid ligase II